MDNEDNMLDDDLLDISLDDLSTEDLEEPAEEKHDEDVIELIDLVEKGDEDLLDLDETKPLYDDKAPAGDQDSEPDDERGYHDSEEIGETADISRSDLTLGDMLSETGVSESDDDIKSGEDIDQDFSDVDDEEDLLNDSLAYINADSDGSPVTEDISDELIEEDGPEDSAADEDIDFEEPSDDLLDSDEGILGESTGELNAGTLGSLEDEESVDDSQQDPAIEESSISDEMEEEEISAGDDFSDDAEDLEESVSSSMDLEDFTDDLADDIDESGTSADMDSVASGEETESTPEDVDSYDSDNGIPDETFSSQLTDQEDLPEDLSEGDDVQDQSVDEKIELAYAAATAMQEEGSPDEGGFEEGMTDSEFPADDGADVIEKEEGDEMIDTPPDEISDSSYGAGTVIVSEEKIEEIVNKVVGEVVEKVARQVFTEVAEKVITDAIEGLKKSLEADSE